MKRLTPALLVLALAACSHPESQSARSANDAPAASTMTKAELRSASRSVADYFKDEALRAATLDACGADSEAQYDAYAKLPACANARKAGHLIETGRTPE